MINLVFSDSFTSKLYFLSQKRQNQVENNKAKRLCLPLVTLSHLKTNLKEFNTVKTFLILNLYDFWFF